MCLLTAPQEIDKIMLVFDDGFFFNCFDLNLWMFVTFTENVYFSWTFDAIILNLPRSNRLCVTVLKCIVTAILLKRLIKAIHFLQFYEIWRDKTKKKISIILMAYLFAQYSKIYTTYNSFMYLF